MEINGSAGSSNPPPNNNKNAPTNSNEKLPTFSCERCGKEFTSKKALGGHRMCHSREDKRHVAPPPLAEQKVRILGLPCPGSPRPSLANWAVTGKRGRGPANRPVIPDDNNNNNNNIIPAVPNANNVTAEMFELLTNLIKFVSERDGNNNDPAAAAASSSSCSNKRLKPDYHLAPGLRYDEATDSVILPRGALLIRERGETLASSDREVRDHDADKTDEAPQQNLDSGANDVIVPQAANTDRIDNDLADDDENEGGSWEEGLVFKFDLNKPYVSDGDD